MRSSHQNPRILFLGFGNETFHLITHLDFRKMQCKISLYSHILVSTSSVMD
jgi:hypothetical protein